MTKNKLFIFALAIVFLVGGGFYWQKAKVGNVTEKVYIAVEGEGRVAVIDPASKKQIKSIDLSLEHDGEKMLYAPHNVQVSPSGKEVWVTANLGVHDHMSNSWFLPRAEAHGNEDPTDEVIVISTQRDTILARIAVAPNVHLAHVVFSPDGSFAYVTAQKGDTLYKINTTSRAFEGTVSFPVGAEPHGLRISPDGKFAYIATMGGAGLGVIDLASKSLSLVPLSGKAVQVAATSDGREVLVSLYDTKQLAVYGTSEKNVRYVELPEDARGPVQIYIAPDDKYVYVADQGYYFNQPSGSFVYKIDIATGQIAKIIKAGEAPHGVVTDVTGARIFVTNLLSGDLSIIDASTDTQIARIPVGKEPNGVTYWRK